MSVSVDLLPFANADIDTWVYSHDVVSLGYLSHVQRNQLSALLGNARAKKVPVDFGSYLSKDSDGEHRFGPTTEDAYGALWYVTAGDLKFILNRWITEYPRKIAAIAYINALPDDWCVALYWR